MKRRNLHERRSIVAQFLGLALLTLLAAAVSTAFLGQPGEPVQASVLRVDVPAVR